MQGPTPASIRAGHWRVGGLLTGAASFWTGWSDGRRPQEPLRRGHPRVAEHARGDDVTEGKGKFLRLRTFEGGKAAGQDELEIAQLALRENNGRQLLSLSIELWPTRCVAGNQVLEDATYAIHQPMCSRVCC